MSVEVGEAIGDVDNDDYVAQVLADEARNSSMKYSSLGAEAYMTRRPTGSAPKPNTRFLRHIIKETDNHNTALKRKEEREARERMRQLQGQESSSTKDRYRHRSHRSDDRTSRRDTRKDEEHRHRSHRERHRSRSPSLDKNRGRPFERRNERRDREEDRHRRSRKSYRHRSYSRSRSRSPHGRDPKHRDRDRSHRKRSSRRSRSPESKERRKEERTTREKNISFPAPESQYEHSGNESDPLEDLVGPLPKEKALIRSRGRGAFKPNSSNIDAHFLPNYDPALDVQPDHDDSESGNRSTRRPVAGLMTGDDDWELALEALRDRARWKQSGEERLREAGFNTDIIDRWKTNTSVAAGNDEGRIGSVKWSTKSEGREWDRGKFINKDGHVDVKASW
ncbi:hypothetical protein BJX64DRAFT_249716 [Aspergillus heterothallicus]